MGKHDVEWKTVPGKCPCCNQCKIYSEGPMKGKCIYNGPFNGYQGDDGKFLTIDEAPNYFKSKELNEPIIKTD